jgi:hypothetical protein
MKRWMTLALAASLSGCASPPGLATGWQRADTAIAQVAAGYTAARSVAALFAPFVPVAQQARLLVLAEAVERALAAARRASGLAARRAALREAVAASAAYRLAAGG